MNNTASSETRKHLVTVGIAWAILALISYLVFGLNDYLVFKNDINWPGILTGYSILAVIVERFVSIIVVEETGELDTMRTEERFLIKDMEAIDRLQSQTQASDAREMAASREATVSAIVGKASQRKEKTKQRSKKFLLWSLIAGMVVAAFGFRVFAQVTTLSGAEEHAEQTVATPADVDAESGVKDKETKTNDPHENNAIKFIVMIADILLTGVLLSGGSRFIDGVTTMYKDP